MIGSNLKLALLERIEPHASPVLSLYLDVNPATHDNSVTAFSLRAAEAMRALGLDAGYTRQVTDRLKQRFARAEGRTLAIFAGEDLGELFDAYFLQTELPFLAAEDGALAHWGRSLVAPLLFALDQRERYAVIYVAADRVRVFEAFLGQIDEMVDYARNVDTDDWVPYREARRSPGVGIGVAARGGADVDTFQDRMEEATARLYRSLIPEVARRMEEERNDRIILVGQPGAVSAFRGLMGGGLQERVVGTLPPPANPGAAAHEWLPLVQELIDTTEAEHELALLNRVREEGVWGLQETLTLLQDHRLHTLVVPWAELQYVYRAEGGRVAVSAEEARVLSPGEEVSEVRLMEVLPELVRESATALEFAEGEAEELLNGEFGGMAGLKRW